MSSLVMGLRKVHVGGGFVHSGQDMLQFAHLLINICQVRRLMYTRFPTKVGGAFEGCPDLYIDSDRPHESYYQRFFNVG